MIVGLPMGLSSCLILALSLGVQRNNPWWLGPILRPSIAPWPIPLLIYIGSVCSLKIFTFLLPLFLSYGVTMLVLFFSHQIRSSMYAQNILKSTIILFERRWLIVTCSFASSPLVINVLIFLPKASPHLGSNCHMTSFWLVHAVSAFEWLLRKYLSCIIKSILFHL